MSALHVPAMLLFQDAATLASDVHIIMICEVVLTLVVVLLLLAMAIGGLVVYGKLTKLAKMADTKASPLLAQAVPLMAKGKEIAGHVNEIVADLKPKIAEITSDLQPKIAAVTADLQPKIASVTGDVQHISSVLRSKVDEAGQTFSQLNQTVQGYADTAQDVNSKTRGQVARVNEMVSEALTTTQTVSKQIQHGIKVPVEKIASWVSAAKIGIENLAEKVPFLNQQPAERGTGAASRGPVGGPNYGAGFGSVPPGTRIVRSAEDVARDPAVPTTPGKLPKY